MAHVTGSSPHRDGAAAERGGGSSASSAVYPGDPRYEDLALRRRNERFVQRPACFRVVRSTDEVVAAVQWAVDSGRPVAVRSGGHSLENSVGEHPDGVIIDMTGMNAIYFDPARRAVAMESGATLGEVYRTLYLTWGVTVPGGWCHSVCVGGHIQGGGYGSLSRTHGSVVDHLYAVEVVVVDEAGRARAVLATRESGDPHRDLWWAHTGGGGGNFGVVTRYWLRSPGAEGDDPADLLPRPPASLTGGVLMWSWADLPRESFRRLMRNHADWHENNSGPDSPGTALHSTLMLSGRKEQDGPADILIYALADGDGADGAALVEKYFDAVSDGVGGTRHMIPAAPWLYVLMPPNGDEESQRGSEYGRYKGKAGYLRKGFSTAQVDTVFDHLTTAPPTLDMARVWLVSYGGKVNDVAPEATALVQRSSVLKAAYTATWLDPRDDEASLDWLRRFYRDVYRETGGVPVPDATNDGSYINYPDTDLADPEWNTSGVPWHDLYYKQNYPGLQRVKKRWDPRNVFRHALSVQPAD
ncbi:FAD-dependent oxidoreductase [Streptomyces sp. NPDC053720]|uniref:FAD-dependent oxidoreductase n=1 Tax=Streptomyces sp. NPDC053720 TaxID=3154855 RepID=UPI00341CA805